MNVEVLHVITITGDYSRLFHLSVSLEYNIIYNSLANVCFYNFFHGLEKYHKKALTNTKHLISHLLIRLQCPQLTHLIS